MYMWMYMHVSIYMYVCVHTCGCTGVYVHVHVHVHFTVHSSLPILVGVTFDTGGISIKPSAGMPLMKGDMGGAACVVATVMAIAQLDCPVSVVGLVPLCENMPSGNAVKPGDVVTAMNGTTISVSIIIYRSVQVHM